MNEEPFFYVLHENMEECNLFSQEGIQIKKCKFDPKNKEMIVGVICSFISQGHSLCDIATGKNWRPTVEGFLMQVAKEGKQKEMYEFAKKTRISFLEEKLISTKDEKELKNLFLVVKMLKEHERSEGGEDGSPTHVYWLNVKEYGEKFNKFKKIGN